MRILSRIASMELEKLSYTRLLKLSIKSGVKFKEKIKNTRHSSSRRKLILAIRFAQQELLG